MSETLLAKGFDDDFADVFQQASTYFEALIERATSPFDCAVRLNGEVPAKMEDIRRNLAAILEERLAERGEQMVSSMEPRQRIRYYEDRIQCKLASECRIATWAPWRPRISERARCTGVVLTGTFGLGAVLAALKATGIFSIRFPLYAASAYPTVVVFAALAVLSGFAANHPERLPMIREAERRLARGHAAKYLQNARTAFVASALRAEASLDGYLAQLNDSNSTEL